MVGCQGQGSNFVAPSLDIFHSRSQNGKDACLMWAVSLAQRDSQQIRTVHDLNIWWREWVLGKPMVAKTANFANQQRSQLCKGQIHLFSPSTRGLRENGRPVSRSHGLYQCMQSHLPASVVQHILRIFTTCVLIALCHCFLLCLVAITTLPLFLFHPVAGFLPIADHCEPCSLCTWAPLSTVPRGVALFPLPQIGGWWSVFTLAALGGGDRPWSLLCPLSSKREHSATSNMQIDTPKTPHFLSAWFALGTSSWREEVPFCTTQVAEHNYCCGSRLSWKSVSISLARSEGREGLGEVHSVFYLSLVYLFWTKWLICHSLALPGTPVHDLFPGNPRGRPPALQQPTPPSLSPRTPPFPSPEPNNTKIIRDVHQVEDQRRGSCQPTASQD